MRSGVRRSSLRANSGTKNYKETNEGSVHDISCGKLGFVVRRYELLGATCALAQEHEQTPHVAQVVALDECDPVTFNAALGPGECANIAAGYSTVLSDFIAEAAAGTPNPGWDFEPDTLTLRKEPR